MEGPGGLARMLTWIQGSGLDPMIRSGSEDLSNPAPYFSRFCWFLSLSGTAGFGGGGGAGPGVWRKCEALLVPVSSSQEPLVGEQVLWFDPDIKLPPGVVEELTWWVGAGGSLWVGAACYVVSAAGRCRLADAVGGKWKGGGGVLGGGGEYLWFVFCWCGSLHCVGEGGTYPVFPLFVTQGMGVAADLYKVQVPGPDLPVSVSQGRARRVWYSGWGHPREQEPGEGCDTLGGGRGRGVTHWVGARPSP